MARAAAGLVLRGNWLGITQRRGGAGSEWLVPAVCGPMGWEFLVHTKTRRHKVVQTY